MHTHADTAMMGDGEVCVFHLDAKCRSELAEAERQEYAQHWERHQQEKMRDEEVAYEEALELKYYTQEHTCPGTMRATEYCFCGNVALGCLGGQECSSCFDDH